MKVLLDENLPHKLRIHLPGHEVSTVDYVGWSGFKNGELLRVAEESGFELFVTGDLNLSYQQNLTGRTIAIVVLSAYNWPIVRNHLAVIAAAVDGASRGSFRVVDCGESND